MKTKSVHGITVVLVVLCTLLVGCSNQDTHVTEVPSFVGPWADEFLSAYNWASGDSYTQGVLVDGAISEEEIVETTQRYRQCLENLGFEVFSLNNDGSMSLNSPPDIDITTKAGQEKSQALVSQCGDESGWNAICSLYWLTKINPEHRDVAELMAECLVKHGIESQGFTAEDYRRIFGDGVIPYAEGSSEYDVFIECNRTLGT